MPSKDGPEEECLEKADEDYSDIFEKMHRNAVKMFHAYITQLNAHKVNYVQKSIENEYTQYPAKLQR